MTPNKIIEERVELRAWLKSKELDDEDANSMFEEYLVAKLDQALTAQAGEILEKMPKEKKLPRRFDCPDCVSLCKELDRDDVICAICNGERGYNYAISLCTKAVEEVIKSKQ